MGFLGDNEEDQDGFVEEVSISAPDEKKSESRDSSDLKKEAERKFTDSSSKDTNEVSLEEVHRQNEKIISMLEDLTEDENSNSDVGGAMDGVL